MKFPVKFRGLAYSDMSGKKFKPRMVYGSLHATESGDYAVIISFKVEGKATETYIVKPETIAQLVGYDKDGAEFYSDDTLIDAGGAEVLAEHLIIRYDEIGSRFYFFRLKESAKNDLQ